MNYWSLAGVLSLSAFAVTSLVLSVALSLAFPAIDRACGRQVAQVRASVLWRLRLAPGVGALAIAFGFVLPTFLFFEPRETRESLSYTLAGLAVIGGLMLVASALRGVRAWAATQSLEREWMARAEPWSGEAPLPVHVLPDRFPVVAVVGVSAPRLFVADRVLAECSPRELRAMFAHEAAHVAARDNLKRFLMRLVPDVLWVRGVVEGAWASAAEEAADAVASAASPEVRLDLAEALLHVARLAPSVVLRFPVSAFYLGGNIDRRVRHLLDETNGSAPNRPWRFAAITAALAIGVVFIAAAPVLHQGMESLVRYLP